MPDRRLDSSALYDWADAAVGALIAHTDEINRLNVFPVPDADTGTNMLFTMRAAVAEAGTAGTGDVAGMAAALSRGAAHGARGNSGVILSQILAALADVTVEAAAQTDLADIDVALLGAALRHAVARVIEAMGGEMVPGTVVSVLHAAAEEVERRAAEPLGEAVPAAAQAAAEALDRTEEQLDVLTEAGVVDAGGRGLLVLLDVLAETITGQSAHRRDYPAAHTPHTHAPAPTEQGPEFEVMYLAADCDGDALYALRKALEALGDSVAIAATAEGRHSVHVHTDDAGAAIEAGMAAGPVSRIRISALATGRVSPGGWTRERAVLAVVDGDGAEELFRAEGAFVLRPDPDLVDPSNGVSATDLLRAVVDTGASQVVVLPNGYVSAEDLVAGCTAGIGWGINVVPVPSGSMAQGLAALAVHDPTHQFVDDGYAMARAAGASRFGSVRTAEVKALTWAGTCEPGDGLGISGDEVLVVAPDVGAAAARLTDLLLGSGGELVTLLLGAGADPAVTGALAEHVRRRHPGTEFASYATGHRGDVLLIGVE